MPQTVSPIKSDDPRGVSNTRNIVTNKIDFAPISCVMSSDDFEVATHAEALLAVAFQRKLCSSEVDQIRKILHHLDCGETAIAAIRLTQHALLKIPDSDELDVRVAVVRRYLSEGTPSDVILDAIERWSQTIVKYDVDQPRVPAGNGRESGQWLGSSRGLSGAQAALAIAATEGVLTAELAAEASAGLATFAGAVGFGVFLGAMVVPIQNSSTSEGLLPGEASTKYRYDRTEGSLRLVDVSTGSTIAFGHHDRSGIFRDAETDLPFARLVAGALVFDAAAMSAVDKDDADTKPVVIPRVLSRAKEEAKLCPNPEEDTPHGASVRAKLYQAQISAFNNPQRPLPPSWAVNLPGVLTKKVVYYDDCRESDGTMIEAKGPGFASMLSSEYMRTRIGERWKGQAERQMASASGRSVEWYFAEPEAAEFAAKTFSKQRYSPVLVIQRALAQ